MWDTSAESWPGSSPPTASKSPAFEATDGMNASAHEDPQSTMAAGKYDPDQLKRIGSACGSRLPPASAIQAMFLYELQRDTEHERLFNDQLFRIAKHEDESGLQAQRIDKLESRLAQLEKTTASQDLQGRLATSQTRMSGIFEKLTACTDRMDRLEKKSTEMEATMSNLRIAHDAVAAREMHSNTDPRVTTIVDEIDVLFADRDGLVSITNDLKLRLVEIQADLQHIMANPSEKSLVMVGPSSSPTGLSSTTANNALQCLAQSDAPSVRSWPTREANAASLH